MQTVTDQNVLNGKIETLSFSQIDKKQCESLFYVAVEMCGVFVVPYSGIFHSISLVQQIQDDIINKWESQEKNNNNTLLVLFVSMLCQLSIAAYKEIENKMSGTHTRDTRNIQSEFLMKLCKLLISFKNAICGEKKLLIHTDDWRNLWFEKGLVEEIEASYDVDFVDDITLDIGSMLSAMKENKRLALLRCTCESIILAQNNLKQNHNRFTFFLIAICMFLTLGVITDIVCSILIATNVIGTALSLASWVTACVVSGVVAITGECITVCVIKRSFPESNEQPEKLKDLFR